MDYPKVGQLVRITRGPFKANEGHVQAISEAEGMVEICWPYMPGKGKQFDRILKLWFGTEDTEAVKA